MSFKTLHFIRGDDDLCDCSFSNEEYIFEIDFAQSVLTVEVQGLPNFASVRVDAPHWLNIQNAFRRDKENKYCFHANTNTPLHIVCIHFPYMLDEAMKKEIKIFVVTGKSN